MIIKRVVLIILLLTMPFLDCGCNKTSSKETTAPSIKVINVDEIVRNPDQYKGFLGVEGIIIKINKSKKYFLLGCEDACIILPVKYKGKMPKLKSKIIVYGEIKKQKDGRYFFDCKEVKIK